MQWWRKLVDEFILIHIELKMLVEYGRSDADVYKAVGYVRMELRRAGIKMNRSVSHLCTDSNESLGRID